MTEPCLTDDQGGGRKLPTANTSQQLSKVGGLPNRGISGWPDGPDLGAGWLAGWLVWLAGWIWDVRYVADRSLSCG